MPVKCVFEVFNASLGDKEQIKSRLQSREFRMLGKKPERGPNNASLLPAAQGMFQP